MNKPREPGIHTVDRAPFDLFDARMMSYGDATDGAVAGTKRFHA
jgi:Tfp pilus assembly ATPase PilU